jgi:TolB-like protein/tetratricopeptide (TPR) repeat protein
MPKSRANGWWSQLRERGVLRVAASYAVIAWLLLQIADVTFEPLGFPGWAMPALIVTAVLGFPVAVLLAWFLELGDHGVTRDAATPEAVRPRVHGIRRFADVAIIGVLLATVAVLLVKQSDLGRPPLPEKPSVAVLPFKNLSGDPEQEYFSDGLAEEVLDRLAQVPGLMVVARSSSFSFKDKSLDVRTVAERLGVTAVLEGTVRRDGQRLRLTARLVDGRTGYQLWSGDFDRELGDVFAMEAELAQAVIQAIVPVARGDAAAAVSAAPPTTSLTAYDLYLLGRAAQTVRGPVGPTYLEKSVGHFEQALAADPSFARAQAALANSLVLLVNYDDPSPAAQQAQRRAEAAVYKALALDPDLADAHVAQANFLRGTRRAGAEEAYRRALELNPNSSEGWHGLAVYLAAQPGREAESREATQRALALDPRAVATWANYLGDPALQSDEPRYRAEIARAIATLADVPDALQSLSGTGSSPVIGLRFQLAAKAAGLPSNLPPDMQLFDRVYLWRHVDPERTAREMEAALAAEPELIKSPIMFLLVDVLGSLGEEARLRALFDRMAAAVGAEDKGLNARRAFWFSVFGYYDEAAQALALAEPIPERHEHGGMGASIVVFQALPAMLRVYRETGRAAEADALAQKYLDKWRAARPSDPGMQWLWTDLAALAASEGHEDEAVELLRIDVNTNKVAPLFRPNLPWFRSLEGHPGYDALVREKAERLAKYRSEMLAVEAAQAASTQGGVETAERQP